MGPDDAKRHHWIHRRHPLQFRGEPSDCWVCGGWREITISFEMERRNIPPRVFDAALDRGVRVLFEKLLTFDTTSVYVHTYIHRGLVLLVRMRQLVRPSLTKRSSF